MEALHRSRKFSVGFLGISLQFQGSVYLVAQIYGLSAGAIVGGVVRMLAMINNATMSLLTPVLPTVKIAIAKNDLGWATRACKATVFVGLAVAICVALTLTFFGQRVMTIWLHLDVKLAGSAFLALGLFGFSYLFSTSLYLLQGSMFEDQKTGYSLLVSALVGLSVGLALSEFTGLEGIFFATALSLVVFVIRPLVREFLQLVSHWERTLAVGRHTK
jgi:hypothetical protein